GCLPRSNYALAGGPILFLDTPFYRTASSAAPSSTSVRFEPVREVGKPVPKHLCHVQLPEGRVRQYDPCPIAVASDVDHPPRAHQIHVVARWLAEPKHRTPRPPQCVILLVVTPRHTEIDRRDLVPAAYDTHAAQHAEQCDWPVSVAR